MRTLVNLAKLLRIYLMRIAGQPRLPMLAAIIAMTAGIGCGIGGLADSLPTPTSTPVVTSKPAAALPTTFPTDMAGPSTPVIPRPTVRPQMTSTPEPATRSVVATQPTPLDRTPASQKRTAADYSHEELMHVFMDLRGELMEAVQNHPRSDLDRAAATFSKECRPDSLEALADQAEPVLRLMNASTIEYSVMGIDRLDGRDDAFLVLTDLDLTGGTGSGLSQSLIVFENGRWVDADCPTGRKAYGLPPSEQTTVQPQTAGEMPRPKLPDLPDSPADHSDEQIARSVEALSRLYWYEQMAAGNPTEDAIAPLWIEQCRDDGVRVAVESAAGAQQLFRGLNIQTRVLGVQRIDDVRAWITFHIELEGMTVVGEGRPGLMQFEDGQWRSADCIVESDPSVIPPDQLEPDQRVHYIGEAIPQRGDWDEQYFELTILAGPQLIGEGDIRLPVRIAAVTETLDSGFATYGGWLLGEADAGGTEAEWWEKPCDQGADDEFMLVRGGTYDTVLCFGPASSGQQVGDLKEMPLWFETFYSDELIRVDLNQSVAIPKRQTFEQRETWGDDPINRIGDRVVAKNCDGIPWMEMTVLGPVESHSETTAKLPVQITALDPDGREFGYFPLLLASGPDTHGKIESWSVSWESPDGPKDPDSFSGITLAQGETHEGHAYFIVPELGEGATIEQMTSVLYWTDCWPSPIHLVQ